MSSTKFNTIFQTFSFARLFFLNYTGWKKNNFTKPHQNQTEACALKVGPVPVGTNIFHDCIKPSSFCQFPWTFLHDCFETSFSANFHEYLWTAAQKCSNTAILWLKGLKHLLWGKFWNQSRKALFGTIESEKQQRLIFLHKKNKKCNA